MAAFVPALVCLATVLAAADAPSSVSVRGDTECPTADELRASLAGLVAPTSGGAPDVAELRGRGRDVTVRLANAAGDVIAEKVVPAAPSCAERARVAAVIVAAWEAHLRGGPPGELALPALRAPAPRAESPRVEATEPGATTAPTPAPAVASSDPPTIVAPVATPSPPATPSVVSEPPRARAPSPPVVVMRASPVIPARPLGVEAGVEALASLASAQLAPGARAELVVGRRGGRLALAVDALAVGRHDVGVSVGRGDWRRLGGGVDLCARWRWARVALQARVGEELTALFVDGSGLPNASSATIFDPGTVAAVRLGLPLGAVAPWVELGGTWWPRAHTLYVDGASASAKVPPLEMLLGVGVSFGASR